MSTDASLIQSPELEVIRQDCEAMRGEVARLLRKRTISSTSPSHTCLPFINPSSELGNYAGWKHSAPSPGSSARSRSSRPA